MNTLVKVDSIDTSKSAEYTDFSTTIMRHTSDLVIKNDNEEEVYGAMLTSIKQKIGEIETWRKSITKPLDIARKAVMDSVRTPLDRLTGSESLIKTALLKYFEKKESARRAAEAKLLAQQEAEKKKLQAKAEEFAKKGKEAKAEDYALRAEMVQAPMIPETKTAAGVSFRDSWDAEVEDITMIPREFMIPNMEGLRKIAVASKGTIKVPGVKFICRKVVAAKGK